MSQKIRCRCPSCEGLLWLESSGAVALCPHCGKAVKASGDISRQGECQNVAQALADKAAFWEEELLRWIGEFGLEAVAKLAEAIGKETSDE